jgi:hypothetical protein
MSRLASVVNDLDDPDKPGALPVSDASALLDERIRKYRADPTMGPADRCG